MKLFNFWIWFLFLLMIMSGFFDVVFGDRGIDEFLSDVGFTLALMSWVFTDIENEKLKKFIKNKGLDYEA